MKTKCTCGKAHRIVVEGEWHLTEEPEGFTVTICGNTGYRGSAYAPPVKECPVCKIIAELNNYEISY